MSRPPSLPQPSNADDDGVVCMPVDDNASEAADGGVPAKRPKHKESQKADGKKRGFGPPAAGYVCKACNQPGHWLELCPRYEEYKAGPPPPGYVCARCSQAGRRRRISW